MVVVVDEVVVDVVVDEVVLTWMYPTLAAV
jgi:hypothetical protein